MMQLQNVKFIALCLLCMSAFTPLINAQAAPQAGQSALAEKYELKKNRIERELEYVNVNITRAEKKLTQAREEYAQKKKRLKPDPTKSGEVPSKAALKLLNNEKQRLTVAGLSIDSQESALNRLKRKEQNLRQELKSLSSSIAKSADTNNIRARQQANRVASEFTRLKRENGALATSIADEQRRRTAAELRIEELVRITQQQLNKIQNLEQEIAARTNQQKNIVEQPPKNTAKPGRIKSNKLDLSLIPLEGETPIFQGEDGERIVIRSHSIDEKVVMTKVGEHTYQADLNIEPGKAYFDLRRRRYRGFFTEESEGVYRFIYNLADQDKPVLTVQFLESDSQVVGNSIEEF